MAKVKFNNTVISNTILPLIKTEINQLHATIGSADAVNFPNGEFNWSGIKGELEDCLNEANKYNQWVSTINSQLSNAMVNATDAINSVSVKEINRSQSIVK